MPPRAPLRFRSAKKGRPSAADLQMERIRWKKELHELFIEIRDEVALKAARKGKRLPI